MATPQTIRIDAVDATAFSEVIDVRSPSEFAEDHMPGAINLPVLDDEERRVVGDLYHNTSKFAARRTGAGIIARNASRHLEGHFSGKPTDYRPLIYCWRGGMRSNSLATILASVGWYVRVLEDGYKAYRRSIIDHLAVSFSGQAFQVVILAGLTGCGKTAMLHRMRRRGLQILDLEGLANHRGSILGLEPGTTQPHQKWFESCLCAELKTFDPARPIFVESESHRVGELYVPGPLWKQMKASPLVELEADLDGRVAFLIQQYAHFLENRAPLIQRLEALERARGEKSGRWREMAQNADWELLARSLLVDHYDVAYRKSRKNFLGARLGQVTLDSLDEASFDAGINRVLELAANA